MQLFLRIFTCAILSFYAGTTGRAGVSGNVLINENADRVNSYTVWDYAEGQDAYQNSLLVDLTQPPGSVCHVLVTSDSDVPTALLR